ncbi:MAG: NmrA family NAD(P)-binding protein [Pseudonocardiales bacterium]|nr:NmrA family NAD(P)-binding protein [Pseudonocardiales bacterium]MBV9729704.1 NmrA family NAD(P)-binding protein [Pseudonocardiales bacterium]
MAGVDGVYSPRHGEGSGSVGEIGQGIQLADAARDAEIAHFVYSSVASAYRDTGVPSFDAKWRIEHNPRGPPPSSAGVPDDQLGQPTPGDPRRHAGLPAQPHPRRAATRPRRRRPVRHPGCSPPPTPGSSRRSIPRVSS